MSIAKVSKIMGITQKNNDQFKFIVIIALTLVASTD